MVDSSCPFSALGLDVGVSVDLGVDADDAAPAAVRQIGFLSPCPKNIL
jgi:hypothetical protein